MILSKTFSVWLFAISTSGLVLPAQAHEYWLDPIDSAIMLGTSAIVDIRNGQRFSGAAFPYDANQYQSITITNSDIREPYSGRLGDYPAIHPEMQTAGLNSIAVDTAPKLLTYDTWQKFNEFLDYHGFENAAQRHLDRKLPKTDITESYIRSAKTLLQVNDDGNRVIYKKAPDPGDDNKALAPTNSLFEMVLLDNPYTEKSTIDAKLLFNGEALTGRQVEMFWKGTQLIRLTEITDSEGVVSFKVLDSGDYMLNAVQLVEPDNSEVHWLSYWASITFER